MHSQSLLLLCLGVAVHSVATLRTPGASDAQTLQWSPQRRAEGQQAVLPMMDTDPTSRAQSIETKRRGFLYGPSKLGNTSFYPTGPLGDERVQRDLALIRPDVTAIGAAARPDVEAVNKTLTDYGGFKTIADYALLYEGQWKQSVPDGVDPGMLSNYTSDLLFSMERLSVNPYIVKRLHPTKDPLPFAIDDTTVTKVAGTDLKTLHRKGSLFYVDHSYQKDYPKTTRFTAYCSAYFYIHPKSGGFLPLAIRKNVDRDLIYTPLDKADDWLLAKIMFNVNDGAHGQFFHVANSHAAGEIVYEAAIRTLSDKHPILAILDRFMVQAFAFRTSGEQALFAPEGIIDSYFAVTNVGARTLAQEFYFNTGGAFQGNYLEQDLKSRGLLHCSYGPQLESIPYYEDAKVIQSALRQFMGSFVKSYYSNDKSLSDDFELQSWIKEATTEAEVIDFPAAPIRDSKTLVDILTHMAFLSGVTHHVLNTGAPVASSGVLPFHPFAIYQPVPAAKGVDNLLPFLPPQNASIGQVRLLSQFNRPFFAAQNRTLTYMFSGDDVSKRLNRATVDSAAIFKSRMEAQSTKVRARTFDKDGLSQGMPFVYRALDPGTIPYFFSV